MAKDNDVSPDVCAKNFCELDDAGQKFVGDQIASLLSKRGDAATMWAMYNTKLVITANAGGLVTSLAFFGQAVRAIYANGKPLDVGADFSLPVALFMVGLGFGIAAALLGMLKTHGNLVSDIKFYSRYLENLERFKMYGEVQISMTGRHFSTAVVFLLGLISLSLFGIGSFFGYQVIDILNSAIS